MQREELTREIQFLRKSQEEIEAAAEVRVESLTQQLLDARSSIETEREALQQQLQDATSDTYKQMEKQQETARKPPARIQ